MGLFLILMGKNEFAAADVFVVVADIFFYQKKKINHLSTFNLLIDRLNRSINQSINHEIDLND